MKRFYPVIFALLCILAFTSCKKDGINDDSSQRPDLTHNVDAAKLVEMVNKIRAEGCDCVKEKMYPAPPVKWNNVLAEAAYAHSADMFTNKFFTHKGSDGNFVDYRVTTRGYDLARAGENLAQGQETEEEVINSWLKSPDHCINMMNQNYKEMGAARSGNYWTQVFATPH